MVDAGSIEVGQVIVYKGDMANASGKGAVVAIREHPNSGRMYRMNFAAGKLVPFDSGKSFDVVLLDGRRFNGVYVSNIGGEFGDKSCRFMLGEGKADEGVLWALKAGAEAKAAVDKAADAAKKDAFEKAKAVALEAGKKLGLMSEAEFNAAKKRGSAAAWNLRKELKAAGIKASVKQDHYSAIDVSVAEADLEAAKAIGKKYEAGKFNGMEDIYEYSPCAWGSVFGDVRYVFLKVDGHIKG